MWGFCEKTVTDSLEQEINNWVLPLDPRRRESVLNYLEMIRHFCKEDEVVLNLGMPVGTGTFVERYYQKWKGEGIL